MNCLQCAKHQGLLGSDVVSCAVKVNDGSIFIAFFFVVTSRYSIDSSCSTTSKLSEAFFCSYNSSIVS